MLKKIISSLLILTAIFSISSKVYATDYFIQSMIFDESYIVLGGMTETTQQSLYMARYNIISKSWQNLQIPAEQYGLVLYINVDKDRNYYAITTLGSVWYYNGRWTKVGTTEEPFSVAYSASYNTLFIGTANGKIWGCTSQNCSLLTTSPDYSTIQGIACYGNNIVVGTALGNILSWDTRTWTMMGSKIPDSITNLLSYESSIYYQTGTGQILQYYESEWNFLGQFNNSLILLDQNGGLYLKNNQQIAQYNFQESYWVGIPNSTMSQYIQKIFINNKNDIYGFYNSSSPYVYSLYHFDGNSWESITSFPR